MARVIRQWWTASDPSRLLQSEERLLSALVKHPFSKPTNKVGGLNCVEFQRFRQRSLPTVVLTHGFGSGLSFFYRNIDYLLNSGKVSRVICVDWLGMGGSDRPPCRESPIRSIFSTSFCNSKFSPLSAIDFFLDPLDELLCDEDMFYGGEPLWLVGHSLGGYLAAKYAMRINNQQHKPNLTKLILASPVGFQPVPSNERIASSNLPPAFRLVDALWSANITPQSLVRMMGSKRGMAVVKRALHGRIPHLQTTCTDEFESELDLLAAYLYHITVANPSGEYAMNSLLEPAASKDGAGVFARQPLGGGYLTQSISPSLKSIKVLYGDKDWMRYNENAAREEMQSIQSKYDDIRAGVHIIPDAGHHLYLDNSLSFGKHILED